MKKEVIYAIRVNRTYPIVDIVGRFSDPNVSIRKMLQAALIAIDRIERNGGRLLENPAIPDLNNCVYFSAGFRSFEDMAMFLNSMHYLE